jgi:sigma-54-dependent transcriptional regulator
MSDTADVSAGASGGPFGVVDELIHLTSLVASERDLERQLAAIVSSATRVTGAEAGRILVLDRAMRQLHRLASTSVSLDGAGVEHFEPIQIYARDERYNLGDASVFAAVTGRIVSLPDIYRYTGYDFSRMYREDQRVGHKTRSFVAAPLKGVDGATLGVLQLINLKHGQGGGAAPLSPGAERLLHTVASHAGVAIAIARLLDDNRRLIRQLDRKAEELERENARLKTHAADIRPIPGLIAESTAMRQPLDLLKRAASSSKVTVLLLGETGVGKDVFAKAIHETSDRRDRAFVAQNCAAVPENLLESELFGYRKGAFSGATADKKGLIQEADGGTLLLDEIGDMPLGLQAKILRLLEEGAVRRIGDTRAQNVDVRIIAATNADLPKRISDGTFREDLFYRLSVFPITIPSLRERWSDIPRLIDHFLLQFAKAHSRTPPAFTPRALDALCSWRYPGNVRELRNIVERAVLLIDDGERIDLRHLPPEFGVARPPLSAPTVNSGEDLKSLLRGFEARLIETKLQETGWNQSRAAKALKISRRSLVEKLGRYAIRAPANL